MIKFIRRGKKYLIKNVRTRRNLCTRVREIDDDKKGAQIQRYFHAIFTAHTSPFFKVAI